MHVDRSCYAAITLPHETGLKKFHQSEVRTRRLTIVLSFNPDPNKQGIEVLFSHKINSPIHPPLYFNNQEVYSAAHHKHLGLILDYKLTFAKHISKKISIARKGIGIIKYKSSYAPTKTLDQIYKIFVRPYVDYCDIIYHTSPINLNFMMKVLNTKLA